MAHQPIAIDCAGADGRAEGAVGGSLACQQTKTMYTRSLFVGVAVSCGGSAHRWADPPLLPPDFIVHSFTTALCLIVSVRAVVAWGYPGFIPGFRRYMGICILWGFNGLLVVLGTAHTATSLLFWLMRGQP